MAVVVVAVVVLLVVVLVVAVVVVVVVVVVGRYQCGRRVGRCSSPDRSYRRCTRASPSPPRPVGIDPQGSRCNIVGRTAH